MGRTANKDLARLCRDYYQRVERYIRFEEYEIPDLRKARNLSTKEVSRREGDLLLERFQPSDHIILLDERGSPYSSLQFSRHLQKLINARPRRLVFVVGGAYGFSPEVRQRAQESLSLSPMTFSHQMVRLLFAEQLYRAFSILNHEPYHHQ